MEGLDESGQSVLINPKHFYIYVSIALQGHPFCGDSRVVGCVQHVEKKSIREIGDFDCSSWVYFIFRARIHCTATINFSHLI